MNLMNLLSKPVAIGVNIREEKKKMDTFVTTFHDQFSTLSFNFTNQTTRHRRLRKQQQLQQQQQLEQQQHLNYTQNYQNGTLNEETYYCFNNNNSNNNNNNYNNDNHLFPIPALPPIESSSQRGRVEPLTIEEYETTFRESATDFELIERVFFGSMSCNQLRAALWPYLFGLIQHRGKFDKIYQPDGRSKYVFVEHEANSSRWCELENLYYMYQAQWKSIMPDQEQRFSIYRERKSLIERDVIRCDRLHKFYANEPENLATLTNLLMTYMMYDFDIGYVQGMSDLAGPILYMYNGDLIKSFWVFVEVMKLFRRNFESTQKSIHFQLNCLHELIKNTDPIFAQYLEDNESSNCFFAFKAIVCQFKRELKREGEDDYSRVLFLWDTIWCANRRRILQEELQALIQDNVEVVEQNSSNNCTENGAQSNKHINENGQVVGKHLNGRQPNLTVTKPSSLSSSSSTTTTTTTTNNDNNQFFVTFDQNQSDTPRHSLTETEIFVLALCLSMIRRERDIILANRLDGTDIHLHFINPKLSSNLNGFIEHAINIYSFMKNDFDLTRLTSPKDKLKSQLSIEKQNPETPIGSPEGFDLLKDYDVIVNGASGY